MCHLHQDWSVCQYLPVVNIVLSVERLQVALVLAYKASQIQDNTAIVPQQDFLPGGGWH